MYERILVPTDGSNASEQAIDHAMAHAERHDAELHVVHVIDSVQTTQLEATSGLWDQLEATGRAAVNSAIERTASLPHDVSGEVLVGTPSHQIAVYADDHDIDLIIMGTHGRRGASRFLLGSVTEQVIRRSNIPVLAVPIRTSPTSPS